MMTLINFKDLFAGFIRTRSIGRHFHRKALLDNMPKRGGVGHEIPATLSQQLVMAALKDPGQLLAQLGSQPDGLSQTQADAIRMTVGLNEVEQDKPLPWWMHLWLCYKTPFDMLLTALAAISYLTEDTKATVVIGSMVVLSVAIRFVQETRSNKAADQLKAMVSNTATVIRRDKAKDAMEDARRYFDVQLHPKPAVNVEVPIKLLVPGDVIVLSAGDMIPADCRVLSAKDLFVSQAAMTGESLPVEKFVEQKDKAVTNPLELENFVFMGTNVVSGSATAVVVHTGKQSYFGALAHRVTSTSRTPTQFQAGVNKIA